MAHLSRDVKVVKDHRSDGPNALVARCTNHPRRPSAFTGAYDYEFTDRVCTATREPLNRVHRFNRALGHWKEKRQSWIGFLEIFLEGVSDEVVFPDGRR